MLLNKDLGVEGGVAVQITEDPVIGAAGSDGAHGDWRAAFGTKMKFDCLPEADTLRWAEELMIHEWIVQDIAYANGGSLDRGDRPKHE
jgi:hypothetical protein